MPCPVPCERCHAPLAPTARGGLCPACLAHLAQASWLDPAPSHPPGHNTPTDAPFTTAPPTPVRSRSFGDFELIEEIARGGMGIVFKARQRSLNRIVAVKMIRAGVLASELDIARFLAEAKAAAGLQHPNIIAIHEVGEHEERHYFSMDYVEGRNLSHCVREHPWAAPRAARCLEIVADAVHYAHQRGILHRDLKPSNVILDDTDLPHLTDFGLATRIEESSVLTLSGVILGTPSYMAPEQTGGRAAEIGPATDVYALGGLLYETLTSRPPFQAETPLETIKLARDADPVPPRRLNPNVPPDLETICLKCLEKEPHRRYPTAGALAEDLARFLNHEPIRARPVTAWERGLKWVRRNPWRAALVGACAVAFLAGIGLALERAANHELQSVNRRLTAKESELQETLKASKAAHREERLQRERAQSAELRSTAALHDLRMARAFADRSDYLRRIAEAGQALEANRVPEAERLLEGCPTELRRWEWHYLRRLCQPEIARYLLTPHPIGHIALSVDGSHAAALDTTGAFRLLNLASGERSDLGQASLHQVTALALASRIPWLAIGAEAGEPASPGILAETPTQARVSFDGLRHPPRALSLAAEDQLLLSVDDQGLTAWDLGLGQPRWCAPPPPGSTGIGISASRDGTTVAWITAPSRRERAMDGTALPHRGDTVRIHDVFDGSLLRPSLDDMDDVRCAVIGPHARRVATGHGDGRIQLWNVGSGQPEGVLQGHAGPVTHLAFDADELRLASGGADRAVRVWTLGVGGKPSVFLGHRSDILRVSFSPDGDQVIAASQDGWVRVWHARMPPHDQRHAGQGHSIAFFGNDRLVLGDGTIRSAADGHQLHQLEASANTRVHPHQDHRWLALGERVFDAAQDRYQPTEWTNASFNMYGGANCSAISPDLSVVAAPRQSIRKPVDVSIRRLGDGHLEQTLPTGTNLVYDVAFAPDGKLLAVSTGSWIWNGWKGDGAPGELQLWDWRASQLVQTLSPRRFTVWTAAFAPDGRRIVSGGGLYAGGSRLTNGAPHGEIQVWDVSTGCELFDLPGVSDNVFGIAISPDSTRVAAAMGKSSSRAGQGEVKLWDLDTGAEVLTLRGFPGPVHGVAFSPDGRRLAAIGSGIFRIWSVE